MKKLLHIFNREAPRNIKDVKRKCGKFAIKNDGTLSMKSSVITAGLFGAAVLNPMVGLVMFPMVATIAIGSVAGIAVQATMESQKSRLQKWRSLPERIG